LSWAPQHVAHHSVEARPVLTIGVEAVGESISIIVEAIVACRLRRVTAPQNARIPKACVKPAVDQPASVVGAPAVEASIGCARIVGPRIAEASVCLEHQRATSLHWHRLSLAFSTETVFVDAVGLAVGIIVEPIIALRFHTCRRSTGRATCTGSSALTTVVVAAREIKIFVGLPVAIVVDLIAPLVRG
jgi:hypothetical protein